MYTWEWDKTNNEVHLDSTIGGNPSEPIALVVVITETTHNDYIRSRHRIVGYSNHTCVIILTHSSYTSIFYSCIKIY